MSLSPGPEPLAEPVGRTLELPESGETERLVLARRNLFAVLDRRGDIAPAGARDLGLFHRDTRHLSHFELVVAGGLPVCLSAETADARIAQIDLTVTDREFGGLLDDPQNVLHIRRKQLLDQELVDEIVLTNHLRRPVDLAFEIRLGVDFADIFEVRGARRPRRGELLPVEHGPGHLCFGYRGLDGELYRTVVRFVPRPLALGDRAARFRVHLEPGEASVQEVTVTPLLGSAPAPERIHFDLRLDRLRTESREFRRRAARIRADNEMLEDALARGLADLEALRLDVDGRRIVAAGIPWYAAPFGRDALITGLETLLLNPHIAREALRLLAAFQGRVDDPQRDEQPGKILHELRRGEMARVGEIPHSPYYGTVDATPLFCLLVGELFRWSADEPFLQEIFPAAERALGWVERELDRGGGFLRYERKAPRGLPNQGWKDSREGVSFPDGTIAEPPIALVEAQGYAVGALEEMAALYLRRGADERAAGLRRRARELRDRIEQAFWLPATRTYALALDGADRRVETLTSNPGHLLLPRAIAPERARAVATALLGEAHFSGFGIRTLARGQAVYNPLSYHNGSVWPHDNAIIALGMSRYGLRAEPQRILAALFAATRHFRDLRPPELFCGLARSSGEFLVKYPVSCSPQAWASASWFMLLQAVLGLEPDAPAGRLRVVDPQLPDSVRRIDLAEMPVGGARVTLRFQRQGSRCHVDLIDVTGAPLQLQVELR